MVLRVVPGEGYLAEAAGIWRKPKRFGNFGRYFQVLNSLSEKGLPSRREDGCRSWSRPGRTTAGPPAWRSSRRAVGMDRELIGGDVLLAAGLADQPLGPLGALAFGDHPDSEDRLSDAVSELRTDSRPLIDVIAFSLICFAYCLKSGPNT